MNSKRTVCFSCVLLRSTLRVLTFTVVEKASFHVSVRAVHNHPLRQTSCSRADQRDDLWNHNIPLDSHWDDISHHPNRHSLDDI